MGTMGKAISLRVLSLRAQAGKVVKQIETFCSSDPIMRRPLRRPRREASNPRERKPPFAEAKSRSSLTLTTPIREDSETMRRFEHPAATQVADWARELLDDAH